MKVLVAIANYGTKNTAYVHRLIREYTSMPHKVHLVVLSNIPKDFGPGIEVRVGLPDKNPWSLPFAHKRLFVDRQNDFDLFIYSEDDTLVTWDHIQAFLECTDELPENAIAGFLRYEEDSSGNRFCSSVHSHYHWRPGSVRTYGRNTYAYFTNMHAAFYLLTRAHLKKCIQSGGFDVPPHQGQYDLLCTAATDPYTQCGLEKLICVSRIDEFLVHHLPDQYLGRMGLAYSDMALQVEALLSDAHPEDPYGLIPDSTGMDTFRWEKKYYEKPSLHAIDMIPVTVKTVLSVGCGQGLTEERMSLNGIQVEGICLDRYMKVLCHKRGIRCYDTLSQIRVQSPHLKYEMIYLSDTLSYVNDPENLYKVLTDHLVPCGYMLLEMHNIGHLAFRNALGRHASQQGIQFNFLTPEIIKRWSGQAHLKIVTIEGEYGAKADKINRYTAGILSKYLSNKFLLLIKNDQ